MKKEIWFDMDGTIADLYGVEGWLDYLVNSNPYPYANAKPLVNMSALARLLNALQKNGWKIGVISWLSKNSNEDYDKAVTNAKEKWLATHLKSVKFDSIQIVKYGTPKYTLGSGILFDDEDRNREAWGKNAYDVDDILGVLKALKTA